MVAGEASGDLHGADLARQLLARRPQAEVFGVAGEQMRSAGVRALYRIEDITGLGLTELASTIKRTLVALRKLRSVLKRERPDLLIVIDFAEFNMILAGVARRAGVPVLYYITPQVWAWRRGRIRKIIARADRLAVVLPFEAELYAQAGPRVSFVGHPLLDRVAPAQGRAETLARHGLPPNSRLLAILPGSRRGEIRYLLEPMAEAARVLARDHDLQPCLALAPTLARAHLSRGNGGADLTGIPIVEGDTYSIVAASEVALVASGTATLETALLGCPMVIAYKLSASSYLLGRMLVRALRPGVRHRAERTSSHLLGRMLVRGVDSLGMPNILAGRRIVPELLQGEVTAANLVRAAENLLIEPVRSETVAALKALRGRLGAPGAAARVAEMALEMIA